ncbi:MAG TPA: TonB family protein [Bacteroidia bacterium]|nr:TonB family protein [Bacteroidia bacterium]
MLKSYTIRFLLIALCTCIVFNAHAQDKKNGKCKITESNGDISEGKKKRGEKTGLWKTSSPGGRLLEATQFKKGLKHGHYTLYHRTTGKMYMEGNYVNDKRDGKWITYTPSGDTSHIETFRNDTLHGYYRKTLGAPHYTVVQGNYVNGIKEGLWCQVFKNPGGEDGTDTCMYRNNMANGRRVNYYDGMLYSVGYYIDGKLSGENIIYHRNSTQPYLVTYYKAGERDSIHRQYSTTGKKLRECWYRREKVVRYDSAWEKNGMVQSAKLYSEEGTLTYSETWSVGKLERKMYFGTDGMLDSFLVYNSNGNMIQRNHCDQNASSEYARNICYYQWNYDESGLLKMHGKFVVYQQGVWVWVDSNQRVTKEIMYKDGIANGRYTSYYPNGKVKVSGICANGYLRDSIVVKTTAGVILKKGTPQYEQIFQQHLKEEKDVGYSDVDQTIVITRDHWPEELVAEEPEEEVFTFAEVMPGFPGGDDSLHKFLQANIRYPAMEKEAGKQGTVYIGFVVGKDGTVQDVVVLKGVAGAPGLEKEAVRVVKQMPRWQPAKQNGRAVRMRMTLPVKFKIN